MADGVGRRRPRVRLHSLKTQRVRGKGRPGKWPSASVGRSSALRLSRLRRQKSSLTGLCFPARRRAGPAGRTSPLRASAGLATALTSPRPPAAGEPRTPASVPRTPRLGAPGPPRPEGACARPRRCPPPPHTGPLSRGRSRQRRGGGGARMSPECEEPPPLHAGERPPLGPLGPPDSPRPPAPRPQFLSLPAAASLSWLSSCPPFRARTQPHRPGTSPPFRPRPPPRGHPLPALGLPGPGSGPSRVVGLSLPHCPAERVPGTCREVLWRRREGTQRPRRTVTISGVVMR